MKISARYSGSLRCESGENTARSRKARRAWTPLLAALLALGVAAAGHAAEPAAEPTAEDLLNAADDLFRGQASTGAMTMNVKTARWERSLAMKIWSKGKELSLIQITAPAKEKGVATLKVKDNIWNYLPKVDRTIKVPASMMQSSWMGSHFTNDDLVRESRFAEDYTFAITSRPADNPQGLYVIDCIPKPDAPVVWGKVTMKIRGADKIPTEAAYFDEKGRLVRTLTYSDLAQLGNRTLPKRMKIVPADKPGEYTEIVYDDLHFDVLLDDSFFSLQALQR